MGKNFLAIQPILREMVTQLYHAELTVMMCYY